MRFDPAGERLERLRVGDRDVVDRVERALDRVARRARPSASALRSPRPRRTRSAASRKARDDRERARALAPRRGSGCATRARARRARARSGAPPRPPGGRGRAPSARRSSTADSPSGRRPRRTAPASAKSFATTVVTPRKCAGRCAPSKRDRRAPRPRRCVWKPGGYIASGAGAKTRSTPRARGKRRGRPRACAGSARNPRSARTAAG